MITPPSEEKKDNNISNMVETVQNQRNMDVFNDLADPEDNSNNAIPDGVLNIKSNLIRQKEESKKYGNRLIENCMYIYLSILIIKLR